MSKWKLWRDKSDLNDDIDPFNLSGSLDVTSSKLSSLFTSLLSVPIGKVVVTFRNDNGVYVYGGRGTFSIHYLEVVDSLDSGARAPVETSTPFVVDSTVLEMGVGFRVMHPPPGSTDISRGAVRLLDITAPFGATNIRVLYKGA